MGTAILFIVVISLLVLVHEFGHFWVARRAGMKVEEFGIGFPPAIWSTTKHGTKYSINLILFGGFVRIYGEDGESKNAVGSFGHSTFLKKLSTLLAGVVMNILLAVILLIIGNSIGLRVGVFDEASTSKAQDLRVNILEVSKDSPAQKAGLESLDQILGFRSGSALVSISSPEDVQKYVFPRAGQKVTIVLQRGDQQIDAPVTLRRPASAQEGPLGISLALTGVYRYSWYESIWRGVSDTGRLLWGTAVGYGSIIVSFFKTGTSDAQVTGPIGIATLTNQAARVGFSYLLQFIAMISVNLAILNAVPFPALDGGRALMIIVEKIRGKALRESTERLINALGFAILILLMLAVTARDVVQFF